MKLKQLLDRLFKKPYREKRAMILWKKSYQDRLLMTAKKWEKKGININQVLTKA